jgi:hypothetical protein
MVQGFLSVAYATQENKMAACGRIQHERRFGIYL